MYPQQLERVKRTGQVESFGADDFPDVGPTSFEAERRVEHHCAAVRQPRQPQLRVRSGMAAAADAERDSSPIAS